MIRLDQFTEMTRCTDEAAADWYQPTVDAMQRWDITSDKRIAAHLAQTSYECGNYTHFAEDLHYRAQGLADTWPSHFAVVPKARPRAPNALALAVAWNPEKIANIVYANRYGNGDEASGDGWKYAGKGPIQITFLSNYADFGAVSGFDVITQPELLLLPDAGAAAAAWFFSTRKCNQFIDDDDFTSCTKAINAAALGLEARLARYNENLGILARG